jgi:hypothetical protein
VTLSLFLRQFLPCFIVCPLLLRVFFWVIQFRFSLLLNSSLIVSKSFPFDWEIIRWSINGRVYIHKEIVPSMFPKEMNEWTWREI